MSSENCYRNETDVMIPNSTNDQNVPPNHNSGQKFSVTRWWKKKKMQTKILLLFILCALLITLVSTISVHVSKSDPKSRHYHNVFKGETSSVLEILPESFQDSSPMARNGFRQRGDGVGDIKGIQARLNFIKDHIKSKVLYINSLYECNDDDHKAVFNHTKIDPLYGTVEDLDMLLKIIRSKDSTLRLIMDFIPNHTGRLSKWFQKSQKKEGNYTDYYIWAKCDPNKNLYPNNWMSVKGSRAWTFDEIRKECFYHQLEDDKPDLNLWNPNVQGELENILHFWLKKGVDGFHVQDVQYLFENQNLKDEILISGKTGDAYSDFEHNQTVNHPQNANILQTWKAVLNMYNTRPGVEKLLVITAGDNLNSTMKYLDAKVDIVRVNLLSGNETRLAEHVETKLKDHANSKRIGWMFSDKFSSRLASKEGPQKTKALLTLQATLPGVPFNYYGNEIGMTDNPDVVVPHRYRTPMQWNSDGTGFSKNKPWVPRNPNYPTVNVETQKAIGDDFTTLKVYTRLQKLREKESFKWGEMKVFRDGDLLMYTRKTEGFPGYLVAINFGRRSVTKSFYKVTGISKDVKVVFHSHKHDSTVAIDLSETSYVLGPNHAVVLEY